MQNVIDYFDDNSDLLKSTSFVLRRDSITSFYKDIDGLKAFHYEQKLSLYDSGSYDQFV